MLSSTLGKIVVALAAGAILAGAGGLVVAGGLQEKVISAEGMIAVERGRVDDLATGQSALQATVDSVVQEQSTVRGETERFRTELRGALQDILNRTPRPYGALPGQPGS